MSFDLGDGMPEVPVSAPAPNVGGGDSIADLSYRNYEGPLRPRALRWWVVSLATLRANINSQRFLFWLPVGLILLTYLVRTIYFYFHQNIVAAMAAQGADIPADYANPYAASLYNSMSYWFVGLLVFLATLVVGASSIAADNRANALLIYLSRPISRFDYLFGKCMGVFLLVYSLVAGPSLLMYLFFACAYSSDGFLQHNAFLLLRVLLASALPAILQTCLIIGFSAWSKSARVTGAVYAAFYLISTTLLFAIGNSLYFRDLKGKDIAGTSIVLHSSIDGVVDGICQHIYDIDPDPGLAGRIQNGRRKEADEKNQTPEQQERARRRRAREERMLKNFPEKPVQRPLLWAELLIALGYGGIPIGLAISRIRAVEVIRG